MAFENAPQFYNLGRDIVTDFAQAVNQMDAWSATFEARGGQLAIDVAQGETDSALGIATVSVVSFRNDLAAFLDANGGYYRNMLARVRADI